MNNPKISIIIPVYKVEKYLHRCLDSIVNQTFTDWECILVDDGSPDNSGTICDEYAEKDSRFKVFHQDNAGVSAARNKGLDEAKGEWIGFVDSDDWIENNMYEYLFNDAITSKSDVVICGFVGQKKKRIKHLFSSEEAQKMVFDRKGFGGFSVLRLIFAEKIKGHRYDVKVSYMEDNLFFYSVFKDCNKILWDNEPLYHYDMRSDSVTHQYGLTKQSQTAIDMLDDLYKNEGKNDIKESIIAKKITFCISIACKYIYHNDLKNESYIILKKIISQNISQILFTNNYSFKSKSCAIAIWVKPFSILMNMLYNVLYK